MFQKFGLDEQTMVYRSISNEDPKYMVVHGLYRSSGEAKADIRDLPPAIQENRPWIRNLADVQRRIHEFQEK